MEIDDAGQTALHFCASKSRLHSARYLLQHGATSRVKDSRMQQLPLHRAAAVGSAPMIRLFLEDKSPVNATDREGWTALHHAIAEGHGDAALELLKAGADVSKKTNEGELALQLAPDKKVRLSARIYSGWEGLELTSIYRLWIGYGGQLQMRGLRYDGFFGFSCQK